MDLFGVIIIWSQYLAGLGRYVVYKMNIRKWAVEHHPTIHPIPIAITPLPANPNCVEAVLLSRDSTFYTRAIALVDEHNKLVDEFERLRLENISWLEKQMEQATETVKSWPKWKQELLQQIVESKNK